MSSVSVPMITSGSPFPPSEDLVARYATLERTIRAGDRRFTLLTAGDTNGMLERLDPSLFAIDERLPYWAEVWTSAVALAEFCFRTPAINGSTVLELGCGLGLAGIAAAAAGARVVMTDYEPDALGFARLNVERNLPGAENNGTVAFRLMDWRSPGQGGPYDWILGADVAYERRNFRPLLETVNLLLAESGTAIFTDPDRSTGADFAALAEERGFVVRMVSEPAPRHDATRTVVRYELRRGTRP